jgi:hypothetical protein
MSGIRVAVLEGFALVAAFEEEEKGEEEGGLHPER